MSAKLEFSLTKNGKKFAKIQVDDLPWWLSTIIAIIPKAQYCACVTRNFDVENKKLKELFTKPEKPKSE